MKNFTLPFVLCASFLAAANAQLPQVPRNEPSDVREPQTRKIPTDPVNRRDGFFVRNTHVYMVQDGVITRVDREIDFPNGLRVQPSGVVTLRDGREITLLQHQWLDFQGALDDAVVEEPTLPPELREKTRESGISARDGITISGSDVFITRNGVTSKVVGDLHLPNGAVVKHDGTVILANGRHVTLRPEQVMDLHGVLHEAPIIPNPAAEGSPSTNPAR